jgi:recombination protein RecT
MVQARFEQVMGGRAATGFINSVLLMVAEKPELQACTADSIMVQAMRAATIRLSVDKSARQAYLGAVQGKVELIIGWRGIRTMAERTGKFKHINVEPIFEGETVLKDRLRGTVSIGGKVTNAAKIIGRVAFFERHDGLSHAIYRTVEEIHERAKKLKPHNYFAKGSCWQDPKWKGTMEAKDVLVELLKDWAELDPNDIAALERVTDGGGVGDPRPAEGEVVDVTPSVVVDGGEGGGVGDPRPAGKSLKERIEGRILELAKKGKTEADSSQRAKLALFLNACFPNDPMKDKKRNEVCKALTGYATVEKMPGATVLALIWCICRVQEGQFVLDEKVAEEVREVVG